MRTQTIAIAIFFCLLVYATNALACKCASPTETSQEEAYKQANIIVLAEPVLFSKGWNASGPLVDIKIHHIYKGKTSLPREITVKYNPVTAACGVHLEKGKSYILGMYDLYSLDEDVKQIGGYRMMTSCHQNNIYHYIINHHHLKKKDEK